MTTADDQVAQFQAEYVIESSTDVWLAQLHAEYDRAQAEHQAAEERLNMIKAQLKVAMFERAAPGVPLIELRTSGHRALIMRTVVSWRLDTKRFKAEQPEIYVRYAVQSAAWKLERARS